MVRKDKQVPFVAAFRHRATTLLLRLRIRRSGFTNTIKTLGSSLKNSIYLSLGHITLIRLLAKKAGCMNFMPDENTLLVGEKSGYVVNIAIDGDVAPLPDVDEQDEFLGHLSLLTSVVRSYIFCTNVVFIFN